MLLEFEAYQCVVKELADMPAEFFCECVHV